MRVKTRQPTDGAALCRAVVVIGAPVRGGGYALSSFRRVLPELDRDDLETESTLRRLDKGYLALDGG